MKSILSFFALFAGIFAASAQVDTIYTHEGVIPCNITEITETAAKYQYPGESHSNSLSLNAVSKIVFRSGRVPGIRRPHLVPPPLLSDGVGTGLHRERRVGSAGAL